jgi:hypothetical protein
MTEPCMFNIVELPNASLRKLLPKASSRALVHLLNAYPRTVGRTFMTVLTECMSPATLNFLREEMIRSQLPSYVQIREAESELLKIIQDERLVPPVNA